MDKIELNKLAELEKKINVIFKNKILLKNAMIHRSYLNENKDADIKENNERLEFLGDAVLELIITEYLFNNFPEKKEGELTSFRAATVKTTSLAESAEKIDLGSFLYLSKGEEMTGGRNRPYILANTFEALTGAIYLDQGLDKTKDFLQRKLFRKLKLIIEKRLDIDDKSKLQEISQDQIGVTPIYECVSATGPDHDKQFLMEVKIKNRIFGKGSGRNKQEAEQNAAKFAVKNWKKLILKNNLNTLKHENRHQ